MYRLVRGKVESYLLNEIGKYGKIQLTLIDPEGLDGETASRMAREAEAAGSTGIMVGGSTIVSPLELNEVVKAIKSSVNIPVILFPNNVSGISRYADAIWFMSLLNSFDPYFLIGAQMLGAPLVKRYGLEPIPMGYIVIGEGSAVSLIGHVKPIPPDKPKIAAAYALAAQYLGMRFVYLEAGSGAEKPIPVETITAARKILDIPLIVGGGIRSGEQARVVAEAGADIIVTGTVIEKEGSEKIGEIVRSIRSGA